jgi:GTP-binding protein
MADTAEKIRKRPAAYPGILATSSEKVEGLQELREAIGLTVGIAV